MQFLKIKSVQTFDVSRLGHNEKFEGEYDPIELATSKLSLCDHNLGARSSFYFLRPFTALKHLNYEYKWQKINAPVEENPAPFMEALSNSQSTLETLRVKIVDQSYRRRLNLGSLIGLQRLRNLDIDVALLTCVPRDVQGSNDEILKANGFELPRSLESLNLRGVTAAHLVSLYEMTFNKEIHTPFLEFLDVGWGRPVKPDKPTPEEPRFFHESITAKQAHAF